jgi:hypothetical protein
MIIYSTTTAASFVIKSMAMQTACSMAKLNRSTVLVGVANGAGHGKHEGIRWVSSNAQWVLAKTQTDPAYTIISHSYH